MEILGNPSWLWGLSLIVLTMTIHAAAVLIVALGTTRIRVQWETRSLHEWNLIAIQICATGLIGLLLAVLHFIECGIWAAVYLWVGALDSPTDALIYSVDLMAIWTQIPTSQLVTPTAAILLRATPSMPGSRSIPMT